MKDINILITENGFGELYTEINPLSETSFNFINKDTIIKITIRTASEASRSDKQSTHSPSIKINENLQLIVPTKELNKKSSEYKIYQKHKAKLNSILGTKQTKIIENIISMYQMLIVAVWYTDDNDVNTIVQDFIQQDIKQIKLNKTPTFKSQKELDQDKVFVANYIKGKLDDKKVVIKFSSNDK